MIILEEQISKAYKRTYYHGQSSWFLEEERIHKDVFYLTTYLPYAITYACDYGSVFSYKLKKDTNIFNAKSKRDFDIISEAIKDNDELLGYLDRLATDDWIFEDDFFDQKIKTKFINIIKSLGYDGFFNYEVSPSFIKRMKKLKMSVMEVMINNPSIGIFNKDILLPIETLDYKYFEKSQDWISYKEKEETYICYRVLKLIKENQASAENIRDLIDTLINDGILVAHTSKEIFDIVMSINIDELMDNEKDFMEKFHYLNESKNPYRNVVKTSSSLCFDLHKSILFEQIRQSNQACLRNK